MSIISSPKVIESAGNKPKLIEEFVGRINTGNENVSIAKMKSPDGWVEPGQTPEFDEYTVVLKGTLHVKFADAEYDVQAGQAVFAPKGKWVQYSTPDPAGAEYIAVCVPAFSIDSVNRDS